MILDDSILKFLSSGYGEKILRAADLHGQTDFKYGKKSYPVKELINSIDAAKQMRCVKD